MSWRDYIANLNPEAIVLDGLDEAIIGFDAKDFRVVYSYDKILDIFMEDSTEEDAIEYIDFNIVGLYAGPMTPIILDRKIPGGFE